jgi:nitroreductase
MSSENVISNASIAAVEHAITSRMSVRAFTEQEVSTPTISHLLELASRAPSGTNTQPWKVYVLQGESRVRLVNKVCAAHDAVRADPTLASQYREDFDYYPEKWVSPYIDRRRENGWSLYGLLGIGKGDKEKMHLQHQRNYRFFDAPLGLMFTVEAVKKPPTRVNPVSVYVVKTVNSELQNIHRMTWPATNLKTTIACCCPWSYQSKSSPAALPLR